MSGGYGSIPMTAHEPDTPSLKRKLIAEVFGTCVLVQVGCGGLCAGLYMDVYSGLWQNAVIWLLGAMLAIYAVGNISGAHLNPAVSLAFAIVRPSDFGWKEMVHYWAAQLVGGVLAGALNFAIFATSIAAYEAEQGLSRGSSESIKSASAFGDYYSHSSGVGGPLHAIFIEAFGTAFLTFVVFSVTNSKNNVPGAAVGPLVGTAIGMMVALCGALTGAGINPARDLGPRIVTSISGWGLAAFTDFWVYIIGPLIGGPIGAFLADRVLFMD